MKRLQKLCHKIAVDNGFWEKALSSPNQGLWKEYRNNAEMIALMHSELSEALEAMRNNNWQGKDCVGEELADCVIRILDFCEARNIDLGKEILKKIKIVKKRPYKHGKQF